MLCHKNRRTLFFKNYFIFQKGKKATKCFRSNKYLFFKNLKTQNILINAFFLAKTSALKRQISESVNFCTNQKNDFNGSIDNLQKNLLRNFSSKNRERSYFRKKHPFKSFFWEFDHRSLTPVPYLAPAALSTWALKLSWLNSAWLSSCSSTDRFWKEQDLDRWDSNLRLRFWAYIASGYRVRELFHYERGSLTWGLFGPVTFSDCSGTSGLGVSI